MNQELLQINGAVSTDRQTWRIYCALQELGSIVGNTENDCNNKWFARTYLQFTLVLRPIRDFVSCPWMNHRSVQRSTAFLLIHLCLTTRCSGVRSADNMRADPSPQPYKGRLTRNRRYVTGWPRTSNVLSIRAATMSERMPASIAYAFDGHSRSTFSVPIESPYGHPMCKQ